MTEPTYRLHPVGVVASPLTDRDRAPRQGDEGAPPARVVWRPEVRQAAADLQVGERVLVLTWLHLLGRSRSGDAGAAQRRWRPNQSSSLA